MFVEVDRVDKCHQMWASKEWESTKCSTKRSTRYDWHKMLHKNHSTKLFDKNNSTTSFDKNIRQYKWSTKYVRQIDKTVRQKLLSSNSIFVLFDSFIARSVKDPWMTYSFLSYLQKCDSFSISGGSITEPSVIGSRIWVEPERGKKRGLFLGWKIDRYKGRQMLSATV